MGVNTNNMPVLQNEPASSEFAWKRYNVSWGTSNPSICLTKTGAVLSWFEGDECKDAFCTKKSLPMLAKLSNRQLVSLMERGKLRVSKHIKDEAYIFDLRDAAVAAELED